ncbi:MAG: alpha/beta hydrolase [Nitrososphaeraceae archaeon]
MKQNQTVKHVQQQFISELVTIASAALLLTLITFHTLQFIFVPSAHGMVQKLDGSKTETGAKSYQYSDIISTRGHFDYHSTGQLIQGHNITDYAYSDDFTNNSINKVFNKFTCPPGKEIAIYIHGAWTDDRSANEQFNRTAMSLMSNNYTIPLFGFSWDSNTPIDKDGWATAKNIAEMNGPKLAQFVVDFKNKCKDTDIRFIAHSLGAEVVNSTLASLSSNQQWNDKSRLNITSVHLLGAAIDRSSVAGNATFGKAIDKLVGDFYNLRNSEDNMLEYVYKYVEEGDALGLLGISHSMPLPKNYFEREVNSEIPPIQDVDGNSKLDCFDFFVILPGDNHCGYIGARGLSPFDNIPRNDGAIDIVVQDWSMQ